MPQGNLLNKPCEHNYFPRINFIIFNNILISFFLKVQLKISRREMLMKYLNVLEMEEKLWDINNELNINR